MKWYELILHSLSNDTGADITLLIETPEIVKAIQDKLSYDEILNIANEVM